MSQYKLAITAANDGDAVSLMHTVASAAHESLVRRFEAEPHRLPSLCVRRVQNGFWEAAFEWVPDPESPLTDEVVKRHIEASLTLVENSRRNARSANSEELYRQAFGLRSAGA